MKFKLFVGIDQSKKTFDAVMLHQEQPENLIHAEFENNKKGFIKLFNWIKSYYDVSIDEILFCAEHTGVYNLPMAAYLQELNGNLWLESALQIKLSSGVKRGKTDKADAAFIAQYALSRQSKVRLYQLPSKTLISLKRLLSYRERLVKHQMTYKITSRELKEFPFGDTGLVVKESVKLVKFFEKKIQIVENKMQELINHDSELKQQFNLAKSVHGIGNQTALFILVYTDGFTSFDDWRKFACYCGLAPFEYSSGTSYRGRTRISHLANKKLKSLLTMCALNTIKKENEFKIYYDRRTGEGKSAMSTINILRNNLVSRVFAVVKRGEPYVPTLAA
jgi:transposase